MNAPDTFHVVKTPKSFPGKCQWNGIENLLPQYMGMKNDQFCCFFCGTTGRPNTALKCFAKCYSKWYHQKFDESSKIDIHHKLCGIPLATDREWKHSCTNCHHKLDEKCTIGKFITDYAQHMNACPLSVFYYARSRESIGIPSYEDWENQQKDDDDNGLSCPNVDDDEVMDMNKESSSKLDDQKSENLNPDINVQNNVNKIQKTLKNEEKGEKEAKNDADTSETCKKTAADKISISPINIDRLLRNKSLLPDFENELSFNYFVHGDSRNWDMVRDHCKLKFGGGRLEVGWASITSFRSFWWNHCELVDRVFGKEKNNSIYIPIEQTLKFFFLENELSTDVEKNPFISSKLYKKLGGYAISKGRNPVIINIYIDGYDIFNKKWTTNFKKIGIYYTISNSTRKMKEPLLICQCSPEDFETSLNMLRDNLDELFSGFTYGSRRMMGLVGYGLFDHMEKIYQTLSQGINGKKNCCHCDYEIDDQHSEEDYFQEIGTKRNEKLTKEFYDEFKIEWEEKKKLEKEIEPLQKKYDEYLAEKQCINTQQKTLQQKKNDLEGEINFDMDYMEDELAEDEINQNNHELSLRIEENKQKLSEIEEELNKIVQNKSSFEQNNPAQLILEEKRTLMQKKRELLENKKKLNDIMKECKTYGVCLTSYKGKVRRICIWLEFQQFAEFYNGERLFDMYDQIIPELLHTVELNVFQKYFKRILSHDETFKKIIKTNDGQWESMRRSFGSFVNEKIDYLVGLKNRIDLIPSITSETKEEYDFLLSTIKNYRCLVWGGNKAEKERNRMFRQLMNNLDLMAIENEKHRKTKKKSGRVVLAHEKNHIEKVMNDSNGCLYLIHVGICEHFHRTMKKMLPHQGGGCNPLMIICKKWCLAKIGKHFMARLRVIELEKLGKTPPPVVEDDQIEVKIEED